MTSSFFKFSFISLSSFSILLSLTSLPSIFCAKLLKPPPISFDIFHIKTPQLIGIIFGCIVFTVTITAVITLLYKSGTFSRLNLEIKSGKELKFPKEIVTPQMAEVPELHDHLLIAKKSLPLRLSPPVLNGKLIQVCQLENKFLEELYEVGNGTPKFDESAYDPERLWGWLPNFTHERPYESLPIFKESLKSSLPNESHLVIIEQRLQRVIGMISLTKNDPLNLTVQLDNLWITPAFQGKKMSHEAVLIVSQWLIEQGYRRIAVEIDSRHIIGRKFIERCQWKNEGTLRKHRIVKNRNRDTVLYSMLNSDWVEASISLKKHIGLDWKPKTLKIADIQSGKEAVPSSSSSTTTTVASSGAISPPPPGSAALTDSSPSNSTKAVVSSTNPTNTMTSKRTPKKKKANQSSSKKQVVHDDSSSSDIEQHDVDNNDVDNDESDDAKIIATILTDSQSRQLSNSISKTKSKSKSSRVKTENISQTFATIIENPSSQSHPLDLSDPNLYIEDHIPISQVVIDWQTIEKKGKKKR